MSQATKMTVWRQGFLKKRQCGDKRFFMWRHVATWDFKKATPWRREILIVATWDFECGDMGFEKATAWRHGILKKRQRGDMGF